MPRQPKSIRAIPKVALAFGSSTNRENHRGHHPGLDHQGAGADLKVGPGTYEVKVIRCLYKQQKGREVWKRQTDCEEFSRNLGFQQPLVLQQREFERTKLGPGWHEVPEEVFKQKKSSVAENAGFGKQRRFHVKEVFVPPPGSINIKSQITHFNQSGNTWNRSPRFPDTSPEWGHAPNRYTVKQYGAFSELLSRKSSKRGPYDLFTGPRSEENIHNKMARGKTCAPDKYYDLPSRLDMLLHDESKKNCGKFLKAAQYEKVRYNPNAPGPASYDIKGYGMKQVKEALYPFNLTGVVVRPTFLKFVPPGPGRYNPKYPKCYQVKGGSWVFKSLVGRFNYKIVRYSDFCNE